MSTPIADFPAFLAPSAWYAAHAGARYLQLADHVHAAIETGRLPPGQQLPPERDIARLAGVSRVTVRKAMSVLAERNAVQQRQGAGSFVRVDVGAPRLDQTLSALTSFTEYMEQRGLSSASRVLLAGVFAPTPEESLTLGLGGTDRVARLRRLRFADDAPLAIELSSLPLDILPDPGVVSQSLYAYLKRFGRAPVRAIQRLTATELGPTDADLMDLPAGRAVLTIERTGYLANGRPIEWTRGVYRSDVYNFVAELRLSP
ncbi:GntR family transcriptional regulator [Rhodobacteraceae bacterium CCMM004]|nr:GntR family transcriptional regulator [Rhodobacteraceae bacterium CCMM004]